MAKKGVLLVLIIFSVCCIQLPGEQSKCDTIRGDYISEIDPAGMKRYADEITKSCNDNECRASEIYWWITENIEYIPDPGDEEQIQSPEETLRRRGGDCEDISILMTSLLISMGIDANPIFVEEHTLLLVCGLEPDGIRREIAKYIISKYWDKVKGNLEFSEEGGTLELEYRDGWKLKKNGVAYLEPEKYLKELQVSCDSIEIDYEIHSDNEVNSLLIDNELEFQNYKDGEEYRSVEGCEEKNFIHAKGSCSIQRGRFIVENKGDNEANVNLNLDITCRMKSREIHYFMTYLFSRNNINMQFYEYEGNACLFFEASLEGEGFSYPGYFTGHDIFQEENYIINLPEGTCERFSM